MDITLQYFDGCPHWELAASRIQRAIADAGVEVEVSTEAIQTNEQAIQVGFRGSPTILIDRVDHFADELAPLGLSCRTYRTEEGLSGAPSIAQLKKLIEAS